MSRDEESKIYLANGGALESLIDVITAKSQGLEL